MTRQQSFVKLAGLRNRIGIAVLVAIALNVLENRKTHATEIEVNRERLCQKFPKNSYCQKAPLQAIKIQLDRSGEDDEWIRIEQNDNTVKLLHTTQVENQLFSGLFDGALSFVPFPVPFSVSPQEWKDHQTTRVSFRADNCTNDCAIAGVNTLTLPKGTNIRAGLFTIEYQEGELLRSITFRIPADAQRETIKTVPFAISSK
jgi:hypothetical protein